MAIFQMHFPEWKCLKFNENFIETRKWSLVNIGLRHDLTPDGRQAITWTNDDLVQTDKRYLASVS